MPYNEVNTSLKLEGLKKRNKSKSEESVSLKPINWPNSLQEFVDKSFVRANEVLNEEERLLLNTQLQALIERAFNRNTLDTNDWSKQKIPVLDGVPSLQLQCESKMQKSKLESPETQTEPHNISLSGSDDSSSRKRQRMERFGKSNSLKLEPMYLLHGATSGKPIVGKSKALEKKYLRLTAEPNPNYVRPQKILEKSIKYVLKEYEENERYSYILDQLKSIRQDLTVQHIKNEFTIAIYETNAKISLQNDDLGEFNQCQSQLKNLYYINRKKSGVITIHKNELEFLSYRLIYMMVTGNYSEVYKIKLGSKAFAFFEKSSDNKGYLSLLDTIFQLNESKVTGDFYKFFKIIDELKMSPLIKLGYRLIMSSIFEKEVMKSLFKISKSYRVVQLHFLVSIFKFESEENFKNLLKKFKLDLFITNKGELDCVSSRQALREILNDSTFKKVDIEGQK